MRSIVSSFFAVLLLPSCSANGSFERADNLPAKTIVAKYDSDIESSFAIQRTFSGGATGDTLYKVWSCAFNLTKCEVQGIVDTHDGPAPTIEFSKDGASIILSNGDTIWNFSNRSMSSDGKALKVYILYRE